MRQVLGGSSSIRSAHNRAWLGLVSVRRKVKPGPSLGFWVKPGQGRYATMCPLAFSIICPTGPTPKIDQVDVETRPSGPNCVGISNPTSSNGSGNLGLTQIHAHPYPSVILSLLLNNLYTFYFGWINWVKVHYWVVDHCKSSYYKINE